jgi:hypothetical protein
MSTCFVRLRCGATSEAWFGQVPDDFIGIVTGAARYTTPQMGNFDTVVVDDDEDADGDDACYSTPPGAFEPGDPWFGETGRGGGGETVCPYTFLQLIPPQ